jgi:hypothetical protein
VRHPGQRDAVVLHTHVQDVVPVPAEVGDERVVGVEHEAGARRAGDDGGPAVGDRLELPVAVELVAEQVGQEQRARLDVGDDAVEPELVDLEEAEVAVAVHERGRHAAGHVRAGPVVHEPNAAAAQDGGHHRSGRRLPVRRADDRAAALQPAREGPDRVGLEPQ